MEGIEGNGIKNEKYGYKEFFHTKLKRRQIC